MLVIRLQRTGRKGHAQFRVVVQDSRRTPTSGKIVAPLGYYNPHTKTASLNREKAEFYLEHGAQPSDRVVKLFSDEGIKLPKWVAKPAKKTGEIRNVEKLRRNRPPEPEEPAEPEVAAEEAPAEEPAAEAVDDAAAESPAEETAEVKAAPAEAAADDKEAEA